MIECHENQNDGKRNEARKPLAWVKGSSSIGDSIAKIHQKNLQDKIKDKR